MQKGIVEVAFKYMYYVLYVDMLYILCFYKIIDCRHILDRGTVSALSQNEISMHQNDKKSFLNLYFISA